MVLNLDLNFPPVEGTSGPMNPQVVPTEPTKGLFCSPIDVEAINDYDDDELKVLPSSAAFPQGRNRARRNHRVTVDLEAPMEMPPAQTGISIAERVAILLSLSGHSTTERASTTNRNNNQQYADLEEITNYILLSSLSGQSTTERASTTNRNNNQQYVGLEEINNYKMKNTMTLAMEAPSPPRPPPKEPTFACPLCFEPLKSPCSTVCGHIFCQSCIEASITSSLEERKGRLCPTCRYKLPAKKCFHRVYLPNAE